MTVNPDDRGTWPDIHAGHDHQPDTTGQPESVALPATRVEGEPGDWVAWFDGALLDRYQYRADAIGHIVGRSHNTPGHRPLTDRQIPVIDRPGAGTASGITSRHA